MRAHFTVPMGMRTADRRNVAAIMERCRAAGMAVELQFIGEDMPRAVEPPTRPTPAALEVGEYIPDRTNEQTLARGRYDWLISIGMDPLNAAEVTRRDYPEFDAGITP